MALRSTDSTKTFAMSESGIVSSTGTNPFSAIEGAQAICEQPSTSLLTKTAAPLSFEQEEIWRSMQAHEGESWSNEVVVLRHRGRLDREALQGTLNEITRRQGILRTIITSVDGNPRQVIAKPADLVLVAIDRSGLPKEQQQAEVSRIIEQEARQPFDLCTGMLIRAHLLRFSEEDHAVLVTVCALAGDEWSRSILEQEFEAVYQAYTAGGPTRLSELPAQYVEYAEGQRRKFGGDILAREMSYWRARLAGIPPVLELPTERPRSLQRKFGCQQESLKLSRELRGPLEELASREAAEIHTVLLAAWKVLLFRYTHQQDIVLGAVLTGRDWGETQDLIGPFERASALRGRVNGDEGFRVLLRRTRDEWRNDNEHQSVPIGRILRELGLNGAQNWNAAFGVQFSFVPRMGRKVPSAWKVTDRHRRSSENVDIQLKITDDDGEDLKACFSYNSERFDAATILRMAGHFETLLQGVVVDADSPVSLLPMLRPNEWRQLLEWNDTQQDYPRDHGVHQLFEEQARRTPDDIAVVFEKQQVTYAELNKRANELAHHLRSLGVRPDGLVGICLERSVDMIVGLLGILKAGGAYVPMDPQYPASRIGWMLEDSGLKVLVTQNALRDKFSEFHGELVCLDSLKTRGESGENFDESINPENLAYVIFTSGSTGRPKGVQVSHRALVNFLSSMRRTPGLTAGDKLLAVTTISFDIAALELYLPLIVGGTLLIATRETTADGYRLRKMLEETKPTVMQATPATWRMLLEVGWEGNRNLKILCGGEGMPPDLAVELLKRSSVVWNMYGPTETTVWSTTCRITEHEGPVTIGKPIANTVVHVLDHHLQPVPVGVSGELYIGGDGVARGYLRRPELNAEKFIADPFRERQSGERLYRTGDLARYRANGEIECLGRIDHQVKVRGFRIELGEIEAVLVDYPGAKQNVVVAREDATGEKRLVAYVAVGAQKPLGVDKLREFLKQKLPDYMVPSLFVFLEALPLTPNGKVDRKALLLPEQPEETTQTQAVAPRNSVENQLVKIWESVLGVRRVGVQENFFELGGHSLLVAKLLRRIEHAFGQKLSMTAIFEAPTIAQQASLLNNKEAQRWPSAVVPIQPYGSREPLFCFGFGAGPIFRSLALRLGNDQPFLGIDPMLLEGTQVGPPYAMEDVAACLAKQIQDIQRDGPYHLGGICGGGLVAYATARHLLEEGQQVGLLALFEPHSSYYDYFVEHARGAGLNLLKQRLRFHWSNLRGLQSNEARSYIRDHIRERGRVLLGTINSRLQKTRNRQDRRPRNIRNILGEAYRDYRPQPFAGRVALFQATHREPGDHWERAYWENLASQISVHEVPGYSNWIVRFFIEPSVGILADILKRYLLGQPVG